MNSPFFLLLPQTEAIPLIFDSPHSGTELPDNMRAIAPHQALMTGCDAFIDELWGSAVQCGASLLAARFHRTYIDVNRSRYDIDPDLLDEPWPERIETSAKSKAGMGLIRRLALPGVPMYDRKLTVSEVRQRLDNYYLPYHRALESLIEAAHARSGATWHIDCHSMKSVGNAMNVDCGEPRPDFVVSDRNGSSAAPSFTNWVAEQLQQLGYSVKINDPYQGAELIRAYGAPAQNKHSIQIEINRKLYLDENTFARNEGFAALQQNLAIMAKRLSLYVRAKVNDTFER
ncbi:N-formylglutamate amidohydrolase [Undibacterium sp.]|jgi:N-formylglutamate deformylase|uniref:N-formylglutamate amidohydrolase n=1 Tax=Undibacterium sp. TaxID=1914977 RepID=UPI002C8E013C|nr:N-formylglutamate amidohydrolase [Undibacterium sp.]HTD02389.1 N-formylglutamate amidohydrolase [Undibacterium sp.]